MNIDISDISSEQVYCTTSSCLPIQDQHARAREHQQAIYRCTISSASGIYKKMSRHRHRIAICYTAISSIHLRQQRQHNSQRDRHHHCRPSGRHGASNTPASDREHVIGSTGRSRWRAGIGHWRAAKRRTTPSAAALAGKVNNLAVKPRQQVRSG